MLEEKSANARTSTTPSVDLICSVLGKILSEKYGCDITLTAKPKKHNDDGSGEMAV